MITPLLLPFKIFSLEPLIREARSAGRARRYLAFFKFS